MIKTKRVLFGMTLALMLSQTLLQAQVVVLDLNQARELALTNNLSIKTAREEVNKARARLFESRTNFLPSLSGFSSLQHAWDIQEMLMKNFIKDMMGPAAPPGMPEYVRISFGVDNTVAYGLNLNQPLYTGGTIRLSYQMSKRALEMAEAQYQLTEQKVLSDVASNFYSALFARSAVNVIEEALRSAEHNLEQVQKFYAVGKASRFDVLRAEVQVANYQPQVVSARNNLRLVEEQLKMLLNLPAQAEIQIKGELAYEPCALLNQSIDDLVALAFKNRPEALMQNKQKEMAKYQVKLARAGSMPSLIFGTSYQYQGQRRDFKFRSDDFNKGFTSSLSLSIPLMSVFNTSAKVQQAKINLRAADYQMEALLNGIRLEVKAAYLKVREVDENVKTQAKTITQAEEAVRLAELMYAEGSSTQLDVLNAHLALNQAKMNYQRTLYEYYLAMTNLKKAINQL